MKKVENILKKGVNCQDVLDARRAAFIVDGEAYYAALHESFQQARRTIFFVGWDLHSDTRLVRAGMPMGIHQSSENFSMPWFPRKTSCMSICSTGIFP